MNIKVNHTTYYYQYHSMISYLSAAISAVSNGNLDKAEQIVEWIIEDIKKEKEK